MGEPGAHLLVAVSGIDGSGKTTLVQALTASISARGHTAGSFRALACDNDLLAVVRDGLARPKADRERFLADYLSWSLVRNTRRAVADHTVDVLLADRYLLDHWANQLSFGNDLGGLRWVERLLPTPALTVLLDIDPEGAWHRVLDRDAEPGWQDADFVRRGAAAFDRLAREVPPPGLVRVPARAPLAETRDDLTETLMALLEDARNDS